MSSAEILMLVVAILTLLAQTVGVTFQITRDIYRDKDSDKKKK